MGDSIYKNIRVGRPSKFDSPEDMWEKCICYFEWCDKNSLNEAKVFNNQGEIVTANVAHIRAMTIAGLCVYLNIGETTWKDYRQKTEFSSVTSTVEQIIYEQKFSGAAAGLLNSNIIARDLGLSDKVENENTHKIVKADPDIW